MTDTPKKPGRPRKATAPKPTTPQDLPVAESKPKVRTQVPAEPENATQSPTQSLPTISVEELVEGMDRDLVQRVDVALARHMVKDHRMTWGEVRISMGYGIAKQDPQQDQLWDAVYRMAQA